MLKKKTSALAQTVIFTVFMLALIIFVYQLPCSFTRGSQEGTFCALCFIAGDDTITTDTPGEHKLKEV